MSTTKTYTNKIGQSANHPHLMVFLEKVCMQYRFFHYPRFRHWCRSRPRKKNSLIRG